MSKQRHSSKGKGKRDVSRGNLYSFVDSRGTQEAKAAEPVEAPFTRHTFRPVMRSISGSAGFDKDKSVRKMEGTKESHDYFRDAASAFPADRKYGGGNAKVLVDYDDELALARDNFRQPPKRARLQFDVESSVEDVVETDEDRKRRLHNEESEKMLNSGMSYMKMKKMKEREKLGLVEVSAEQGILEGGRSRAIEIQFNRDTYNSLIRDNVRGEDLTATLTRELDRTLSLKEKEMSRLRCDNLDVGNRGEFVLEQRKTYVKQQLSQTIRTMKARKQKISEHVNMQLISGKTALLFGDDESEAASLAEPSLAEPSPSVDLEASTTSVESSRSRKLPTRAWGSERGRTGKADLEDDTDAPPVVSHVSYTESQRRAMTPMAAMKRESVRRRVIPFSIKELVSSAVRMEGNRREKDKDLKRKRAEARARADALTDEMRLMAMEDPAYVSAVYDEESSVAYGDENDIVSINVADYGLGDEKVACLAEAIKLCPNITYLNIQGNRLTDESCGPILKAVLHVGTVKTLVLSDNKLDAKSIDPLRENIARVKEVRITKHKENGETYAYKMKERIDRRPSEDNGTHKYRADEIEEISFEEDEDPPCAIEDLRLCQSDVDDEECAEFMQALHVNKSLKRLDLSHNLIGDREEETTVFPNFITGGRAIARMLAVNTTLIELNLSWNKIRKNSALVLVKCLAHNDTLTSLNLSSNNMGDLAVQHLANSLRTNNSMVFLDISFNGVMPKGAIVMAHALEENQAMLDCSLEGNCIGEMGGKALLRAMRQAAEKKRQLRINFKNCNLHFEDHSLFDRHEPKLGRYLLHLDDPYDYMIGRVLFEIYNNSFGARFSDVKHKLLAVKLSDLDPDDPASSLPAESRKSGAWEKVELKRPDATGNFNASWDVHLDVINKICDKWAGIVAKGNQKTPFALSSYDKMITNLVSAVYKLGQQLGLNLPLLISESVSKVLFETPAAHRCKIHMLFKIIFKVVFRVVDEDQSCSVDEEELASSLSLLGVSFADDEFLCLDYAKRMIAGVDVDGDKSLDEGEFVRMMLVSYTETIPQSPLPIVDLSGQAWSMPKTGDLQFAFRCEKLPPSLDELQSDDTVSAFSKNLASMEGSDESKQASMAASVSGDSFFTCEQAEMFLLAFPRQKGGTTNIQVIEMFLPQMTSTVEACKFLAQNLSITQIFDLRRRWGAYFNAITGLATGHYYLDMSLEKDRKSARRLAMLNSLQKNKAQSESTTRDTSQNGNYENYRNGCLNHTPFECTSFYFAELPMAGKVSFDYVSIARPVPGVEASEIDSINNLIAKVFHEDLEKYNVAPEFKIELDAEFAAKMKAEKEAEEAARKEEEEREEQLRQDRLAEAALAAGRSAPKKPAAPKRRMSLAMMATKEFAKAAEEAKLKREREEAGKIEETKPKYVSLQETTAMKKNEENMQVWNDFVDTSYCNFRKAFCNDLNDKLLMARLDEGLSANPASNPEEEEEVRRQAMANRIYKEGRLVPIHKANLSLFLKREKQKIATKNREKEKAADKKRKISKKIAEVKEDDDDDFVKKKKLLRRCLSFEHNLNMLEAYLVYNMYLTAEQSNAIVQVFIERRAPLEVVIRCICTLYSRIIDVENLDSALFLKLNMAVESLESIYKRPGETSGKAQKLEKSALLEEEEKRHIIQIVRREVYHRLGMLNAWCPIQPDGDYELDLANYEHREVLKVVLRLGVIEPGPHIINMQYKRSLLEPCKLDKFGKWSPPASWLDGLNQTSSFAGPQSEVPKFGEVTLKYASVDEPEPEPEPEAEEEDEDGEDIAQASGDRDEDEEEDEEDVFDVAPMLGRASIRVPPVSEENSTAAPAKEKVELEYRQNAEARRELARLKTLAGAQGTFIEGWTGVESKDGKLQTENQRPASKAPLKQRQEGFQFVKKGDIIESNIEYILEVNGAEPTFHDDVNTSGITKGGEKNPYFSMVLTASHTQDL